VNRSNLRFLPPNGPRKRGAGSSVQCGSVFISPRSPNGWVEREQTTMVLSKPAPQEITAALSRGERVLWVGEPRRGLVLRSADLFQIPFSLFWAGFAVFWESSVVTTNAPFFFKLWGIPFVLIGIYLVIGRFFVDAKQREGTVYALTNERVLIASGLFSRQLKSLDLRTLPEVSVSLNADGRGTIAFGSSGNFSNTFFTPGWPGYGRYLPPSFELIADAAATASLIREAQRTLLARQS
jgi:hypothetical protein